MTEIIFPEGLEELRGWYMFARCRKLTDITLPKSLKRIGTWIFESCTNLKRVNLMNCEHADNNFGNLFIRCPALEEILCSPKNKAIMSRNGVLYSKDGKTLLAYPKTRSTISILPSVKNIANSALVSMGTKHVVIPEGIIYINGCNFEYDETVETIVFPKTLKVLGDRMFKQATSIERVVFKGDAPRIPQGSPFCEVRSDIMIEVPKTSKGWIEQGARGLPEKWPAGDPDAMQIRYIDSKGLN